MDNQICTVNDMPVNVNDVLNYMKITGSYHDGRRAVVMNEIIKDHAIHDGLSVDDEALQVYSDLRRLQLGLHNSDEMKKYLEILGVTLDEWEVVLEDELYRQLAKKHLGNNVFLLDAWRLIKGIPEVRNHMAHAISNKAHEKGVELTEDELQEASDSFRRLMGMHDSEEFKAILNSLKMDHDDWEKNVHAHIATLKMDKNDVEAIINEEVRNALSKYPIINNMISDFIFGSIIHAKAKKNKIQISDEEIQSFVDDFRRMMKLHSVKSFNIWLAATGLSLEEFEFVVETELIKRKFAKDGIEIIDHTKIDHYLKVSEFFTFALNKFKTYVGLKKVAKDTGITISDDDVNEESDVLRRAKGMHNKDVFQQYLDSHEVTLEDWEQYCEMSAYIRKLYAKETTTEKIDAHLKEDKRYANMVKDITFDRYIWKTQQDFNVKF